MKRYEVRINCCSMFVLSCHWRLVEVRHYRWRWRARLTCFFINHTPQLFGFYQATWRPILRVIESRERTA